MREHDGRPALPSLPLPHHRRPVMVDEVPSAFNPLIEIRRKDLALLRRLPLVARDILDADDPCKVARHLDQDIRQLKLH